MFKIDIVTYALSKKYTDKTAEGLGVLKGADCTVKSITENEGNITVTFEWTGTGGTKETSVMTVPKGENGVSVSNAYIDENQELIIELSDGTEKNAGQLPVMKNTVDTELSDTSENPIANKTVSAELKKITETIGDEVSHHMSITQEEYDKLSEEEKNNGTVYFITDGISDNIENTKVTAESIGLGNVEDKSSETIRSEITKENITNALGYTPPTADGALTSAKEYTDGKIAELINGAPSALDTLGEIAQVMSDNKDVVDALDEAITAKAASADLTAHIVNISNPHGVTKAQIGLDNVENKSSADILAELTKDNISAALTYTPNKGLFHFLKKTSIQNGETVTLELNAGLIYITSYSGDSLYIVLHAGGGQAYSLTKIAGADKITDWSANSTRKGTITNSSGFSMTVYEYQIKTNI